MSNPTITSGRFVWHELVTPDPKAALGFYGELFGWTSTEVDMGPMKYTLLKSNGVDVGGAVAPPPGAKVPPSWLQYCTVPDVDAAAEKAKALGGKVMSPPMDIPKIGRFAVVVDPQGAVLAPFAPTDNHPELEGFPPVGSFCWDELLTSDDKAAVAFYRAVYGYTSVEDKDMGPMGTYHVLKRGERQAGGIMKSPMPGQHPAWLTYVAVSDVDASAKRAQTLKGNLVVPPTDIPNIGRFAVVTDVQGAVLGLFKGGM